MDWNKNETEFHSNKSWRSIPVYRNLLWTWVKQPNNYPKRDDNRKRNRYNKYIPAVGALVFGLLSPLKTYAEVGGVSATAAPVANSSGSVTNQAIQVLQGPYITNTYGGGIQCQGSTLNITPYVTGAVSATKPYEAYYDDPVYDMRDLLGDKDEEGNDIGDGAPDNPGDVLWWKPVRTGQKDNYSLSVGFSATWSTPLDRKLQDQCKEAANTQIEMMKQLTANKRLDFEIGRLKNCGTLLKDGISFHPKSPFYKVCADVVVRDKTFIAPHTHSIPETVSKNAEDLGGPVE